MNEEEHDRTARAEIDAMVPEPGDGAPLKEAGVPDMIYRLRCHPLPPLLTATMEMVGTVLKLPSSTYGLTETTVMALHQSSAGLMRAVKAIEGDPAVGKREKLARLLTTPYPIPGDEEYEGFVDDVTLESRGLPLLGGVVRVLTDLVAARSGDLWRKIVDGKLRALEDVVRGSLNVREAVEQRYQEAHEAIAFHKLDLNKRQAEHLTLQQQLVAPANAAHLDTLPPPNATMIPIYTQQVCSACCLGITAMCDASDVALDDNMEWAAVCAEIFSFRNGVATGVSYKLSSFHPSDFTYSPANTAVFCMLVEAVSKVAVRASGNAMLELLYEWCVSAAGILRVLQDIEPARAVIERFSDRLQIWGDHVARGQASLEKFRAILPTLPKPKAAPVLREEERLLDPQLLRQQAREHVVRTLEGWGRYDTAAEQLTPELIRSVFDVYDTNGNGVIERAEISAMYAELEGFGVPKDARQLDEFLDVHTKGGGLDYDTFTVLLCRFVQR
eukprot:TRINITY_DN16513_c0_g1_i1.p1 TRINITY_DN16513_c0_g1~~TRINITY_DN16513_c0_g1_i1.p1  ORF type:complete len:500 (+),score=175.20 TRINITY_DN16513_c0_g1_i1:85-1584(+)